MAAAVNRLNEGGQVSRQENAVVSLQKVNSWKSDLLLISRSLLINGRHPAGVFLCFGRAKNSFMIETRENHHLEFLFLNFSSLRFFLTKTVK